MDIALQNAAMELFDWLGDNHPMREVLLLLYGACTWTQLCHSNVHIRETM